MNFLRLLLLTFLMVAASSLKAIPGNNPKNSSVQARVLDASTGDPITGARVCVEGCSEMILTDEQGYFLVPLGAASSGTITISLVSFSSISISAEQLLKDSIVLLSEK